MFNENVTLESNDNAKETTEEDQRNERSTGRIEYKVKCISNRIRDNIKYQLNNSNKSQKFLIKKPDYVL